MSININQVVIAGRIGRKIESRTLDSGLVLTKLAIATQRAQRKGDGWAKMTDWHTVVCFGKTAAYVAEFASPGQVMSVTGALRTEKWTTRAGEARYTSSVIADKVTLGEKSRKGAAAEPLSDEDDIREDSPERMQEYVDSYDYYASHSLGDETPF